MKSYPQLTLDYILYKMSYINLYMYSYIIPTYDKEDKPRSSKQISNEDFLSKMKNYGKA